MTAVGAQLQAEVRTAAFEAAYEFGRLAGSGSLTVREFEQAFRAGFLHQASERLKADNTEPTEARLAAATGLTRSSVQQGLAALDEWNRDEWRESFDEDGLFDGLSMLVSLWNSDPRFTQMYGVPRDLMIRRTDSEAASLEDAAAIALPNVPFERVIDELLERGLISVERNAGVARLISDIVPFQNFEAHSMLRMCRLSAGLMRVTRTNYERRLDGSSARRMWEKTFWTERPIVKTHAAEFLEFADEQIRRWFVRLEASQRTYAARNDQVARHYCIAVFAITSLDSATGEQERLPMLRSFRTTTAISEEFARDFTYEVNDTAAQWFSAIDAEHHDLIAAPDEEPASVEICAFMFDIAGSRGDPASRAIDLATAKVARR